MKLQLARGVRDIPQQEQLQRQAIISSVQRSFEKYGFLPLDTPLFERFDVLSAKFAAGEESDAMSETYQLEDNGKRKLGLRFDLTVPLARYVGMNLDLKLPFKRYQIGKVFRDAPVKAGRYREFTQCDADIIGAKSMVADATCIDLAKEVYQNLGVEAVIKVNNRNILFWIIKGFLGCSDDQAKSFFMVIDKLDKVGDVGVVKEAVQKGFDKVQVESLLDGLNNLVKSCPSTNEKIDFLENYDQPNFSDEIRVNKQKAVDEFKELISYFDNKTLDTTVVFDPFLARGLGYYTGSVFEMYAKENTAIGAIGAGGRYDNLIGGYLGKDDGAYPAVGISFGLDRIVDVLKTMKKEVLTTCGAQLFVIPIGSVQKEAFEIVRVLRKNGVGVDIDLAKRNLSKNIKYADSYRIPFALFIGEDELKSNTFKVKNLSSGDEEFLSREEIIKKFKSS